MQATSCLHDALAALLEADQRKTLAADGEGALFALLSVRLRRSLIDRARARKAQKRGGGRLAVSFDPGRDDVAAERRSFDLEALHDALEQLRAEEGSARKHQVIELRFFGGFTNAEAAQVLGVAEPTVERDWKWARAWLHGRLKDDTRTS